MSPKDSLLLTACVGLIELSFMTLEFWLAFIFIMMFMKPNMIGEEP